MGDGSTPAGGSRAAFAVGIQRVAIQPGIDLGQDGRRQGRRGLAKFAARDCSCAERNHLPIRFAMAHEYGPYQPQPPHIGAS